MGIGRKVVETAALCVDVGDMPVLIDVNPTLLQLPDKGLQPERGDLRVLAPAVVIHADRPNRRPVPRPAAVEHQLLLDVLPDIIIFVPVLGDQPGPLGGVLQPLGAVEGVPLQKPVEDADLRLLGTQLVFQGGVPLGGDPLAGGRAAL